jgi:hypothetical protein
MLKQISKIMSVAVLGFCLFGSVAAGANGLSSSVCPPTGCPGIGDPSKEKTGTGLSANICPQSGCPDIACPPEECGDSKCGTSSNPCEMKESASENETKSNFVLGATRYLTFIIVAISVVMFPISIICSIIFFFIKSKYLKTSLILVGVSVLAFAFAILGYTIVGYITSKMVN